MHVRYTYHCNNEILWHHQKNDEGIMSDKKKWGVDIMIERKNYEETYMQKK